MLLPRQLNISRHRHTYLHETRQAPFVSHSTELINRLTLTTGTPRFPSFSTRCTARNTQTTFHISSSGNQLVKPQVKEETQEKNFWGAVTLIIGTAVGPGMLGLPSATIKAGALPSTIAILLTWVYVVSSILLVAELSFVSMEEDRVGEVSFTGLAINAFGRQMGAFVALVYACLSFALIVACVSGIGSIISQWFPWMNAIMSHAFFPCISWALIGFFPFKVIDSANRLLCFLMLFSISALVTTGVSIGRANLLTSFAYASWAPSAILPAIPITVLTLGFHVITPFVCKIVGKNVFDARKAILCGGAVPLIMVVLWNLVVLGLAGSRTATPQNPISLLLSVNSLALPAVQGFAFAALSTSLIGYAVSFPKQLWDTLELISREINLKQVKISPSILNRPRTGRVVFATFSRGDNAGATGQVAFLGSSNNSLSGASKVSSFVSSSSSHIFVMAVVLGAAVLIASFFPATFSKALDFAGVYANCFLFGILPPAMAWIHRSKRRFRSQSQKDIDYVLPGGDIVLMILFGIAVILAIWH